MSQQFKFDPHQQPIVDPQTDLRNIRQERKTPAKKLGRKIRRKVQ